ncbi:MAG TPA: phosphoribosyltransferase [Rubrobacter sp.]|nr:phosphoribosyltransferase [Rubrobacter sp.]
MSTEIPHEKWIFRDRREAGRLLAERLSGYRDKKPIVLALPRGGVVVGYEVARALGAPLNVVVARKLGAPWQPELAVGAIAPRGVRVLNEDVLGWLDISEDEVEQIASQEAREMGRRMHLFRGDRPEPMLKGKTVILVDDGIATGMTVRAAIEYIGQQEPWHLVLAVPVCSAGTAEVLRSEVDDLVSLKTPFELLAIGYWYEDFEQVSDEEVVEMLERSRAAE